MSEIATKLGFRFSCFSEEDNVFMKPADSDHWALLRIDQVREVASVAIIPAHKRYAVSTWGTHFGRPSVISKDEVDRLITEALELYRSDEAERITTHLENL